ncbi:hypothetical protein HET69_24710 [Streptomyces sp. CJ_13]|uniref:DUF6879 family protein n=1 Tax=Streptomyces TaxID=1883 RepID=UPI001BDDBEB0|nr:DUF6879 family protein [Streptomyces sp. CJ_13]MBT1187111.1 hypothetical protein [Streptomyces sp. CJ_13]
MISSSSSLAERFNTFEREAFRLEILDEYNIPSSADNLRAFLAGEPQPAEYNAGWVETVRAATQRGKRMYRVHIVSRPLTDYLRYELGWGYVKNMTGGEEFFILDVTEQPNPLEGVPEFWMFDETSPVVMNYDESGAFIGPEFLSEDRAAEFIGHRDTALAHAEPFPEWWAKHGE